MAWIEKRRQQYRVYERSVTGPKVYEAFTCRQDAESFKELAARFGWQRAVDHVRQPLPGAGQAPTPTPASESGQPTPPGSSAGASLWDRAVAAGADPNTLRRSDPDLPAMASVRPAGMSVGELCRRHIDSLVGTGEETRRQYRAYVRDHVDPYFGDLDAGYVIRRPHLAAEGTSTATAVQWRTWLDTRPVMTRRGPSPDRILKGKTVHNIAAFVSGVYTAAMAEDVERVVDRNPFRGCGRGAASESDTEKVFLTPSHFWSVYQQIAVHYQALLFFLVMTGLRWGEAAGLRVRDVCVAPEHGRPYFDVRTALKRPKGGGVVLGRLKTRKSRRRLVIPDCLLAELSRLVAGRDPDELVFTTVTGAALHHSNFTRVLDRAIKAANAAGAAVPRFRAHALRHTHAAWLLTQGRTMYQVSKQLGHESEQTTDKYYGHLVQAALDANADAVQVAAMGDDWDMSATVDAAVELSAADMLLPELTPAEMDGGDPDAAVAA